ncbi:MAG: hypothetical protein GXO10_06240 [Crenarchaeota archaeon]|nr:hypothetical protein [Thermoproteota archaeon]
MSIKKRGLSEILAAALLALIAAIFGFIIFYYAINIFSATLRATARPHCDFTIVDAALNISKTLVNITPIIYVTSRVPCNITEEYLLINGSLVRDLKMLFITVKPFNTTMLPTLTISRSVYDNSSILEVVIVSGDGVSKKFIIRGR